MLVLVRVLVRVQIARDLTGVCVIDCLVQALQGVLAWLTRR